MLNITQKIESKAAVFALEGRLDTVTAGQLEQALAQVLPGAEELTLDFEKLDYISSAGLRVLLSAQKQMNAKQVRMVNHYHQHLHQSSLECYLHKNFVEVVDID